MVDRTKKLRPCPGGVSVGHYEVTAGTLSCWVKKAGNFFLLSNNHVLANVNAGKKGDPILQPGTADGGTAIDELGKLYEFVPISLTESSACPIAKTLVSTANFLARLFGRRTRLVAFAPGEPNLVDCAIAIPNREEDALDKILEDDGALIAIEEQGEPELSMKVKKSGRSSGTTHGEISQVDVTANVNMGGGRIAIFTDQFAMQDKMSQPGDSGSAILSEDNRIVGLLFAGSDTITLANRFSNVKKALGVEL